MTWWQHVLLGAAEAYHRSATVEQGWGLGCKRWRAKLTAPARQRRRHNSLPLVHQPAQLQLPYAQREHKQSAQLHNVAKQTGSRNCVVACRDCMLGRSGSARRCNTGAESPPSFVVALGTKLLKTVPSLAWPFPRGNVWAVQ